MMPCELDPGWPCPSLRVGGLRPGQIAPQALECWRPPCSEHPTGVGAFPDLPRISSPNPGISFFPCLSRGQEALGDYSACLQFQHSTARSLPPCSGALVLGMWPATALGEFPAFDFGLAPGEGRASSMQLLSLWQVWHTPGWTRNEREPGAQVAGACSSCVFPRGRCIWGCRDSSSCEYLRRDKGCLHGTKSLPNPGPNLPVKHAAAKHIHFRESFKKIHIYLSPGQAHPREAVQRKDPQQPPSQPQVPGHLL